MLLGEARCDIVPVMQKFFEDLFAAFAADCLETSPLSRTRAADVTAAAAEWSMKNRAWVMGQKTIAHGMVAKGFVSRRFKHGVDYFGVALRPVPDSATLTP